MFKVFCGKLNSNNNKQERVSPIVLTLTSRSDSNFERSNICLKENKRDGLDQNFNGLATAFEGKFYGFRQTEVASQKSGQIFLIRTAVLQCLQLDSRKHSVCIIIFSLHLSFLITCNFESSQAVKTNFICCSSQGGQKSQSNFLVPA